MHTLKSVAQRGSLLAAAFALVVSAVIPAVNVSADSLNPLTQRSLLLSSSAPGFQNSDGSGNTESSQNSINEYYAPPGSGPNGQKTGETFTFKVSSDSTSRPIKAFTFQYCTGAAGNCKAPGNNDGDALTDSSQVDGDREPNDADQMAAGHADLDVHYDTTPTQGTDYQIYVDTDADGIAEDSEPAAAGWTIATKNVEDDEHQDPLTGKRNFITLSNASSTITPTPDTQIRVVFKASTDNYITNPGEGFFFVKINTYDSESSSNHFPAKAPDANTNLIDGGVTVANVMTDSIHITTKVLETMSFSVGTKNRDNYTLNCDTDFGTPQQPEGCEAEEDATHGPCDPMISFNGNRLNLGDPDSEYSLQTDRAWDVNSYWRLSSNSSGGATVYYSGDTLRNTVGDFIADMPTEAINTPGVEQFGLGFVAVEAPGSEYAAQYPAKQPDSAPFVTLSTQTEGGRFAADQDAADEYDEATGTLAANNSAGTAKFKFLKTSQTIPAPIAQQNSDVISCATAKMRYVGNIAADTPAGVYTTKINYLAAPQY